MSTVTVNVSGMTCGHCAASVREQVGTLSGVTDVSVDVASGTVRIHAEGVLDRAAIEGAVEEAGYALASSTRRAHDPD